MLECALFTQEYIDLGMTDNIFNIDQTPISKRLSGALGLMRGPAFDSIFLFIPFLLCIGVYDFLLDTSKMTGAELGVIIIFYSTYISTGHAMSTFSRVVWDKESLKKYHWLLAVTPILMGIILYMTVDLFGTIAIMTAYFILQWFHYVRQGYGLAQVYKHLNKIKDPAWVHYAAIYGVATWGFVHRLTTEDLVFLFNNIYTLPALKFLELPIAVISLVTLAYWAWLRVVDFYHQRPVFGYTVFVITHVAVFYLSLIYVEDATVGWIGSAFWHGTQYLFFVWHFNKRQTEQAGRTTNWFQWTAISMVVFVIGFMFFGRFAYESTNWIFRNLELTGTTIIALNLAFLFNHNLADAILWRKQGPPKKQKIVAGTNPPLPKKVKAKKS